MPLSNNVKNLSKEIEIKSKPDGLSSKLMVWQNITIIVADDVPPKLFDKNKKYGKKVIVWKIKDVEDNNIKSMKKISKKIETNIEKLIHDLT